MAIWVPLLVAPILALADQSLALSMTVWACRGQHGLALHFVHAGFAIATIVTTFLAWQSRRQAVAAAPTTESTARRRFLASMSVGASALSILVILAMWVPTWVLSACLQ